MAHLPEGPFSRVEAAAFNAGVRSVIEHATAAADAGLRVCLVPTSAGEITTNAVHPRG
jgi:hypothetical protein